MNWLHYLIAFAVMYAAALCPRRRPATVRQVLAGHDEAELARARRIAGGIPFPASPLDAAMERIVPPLPARVPSPFAPDEADLLAHLTEAAGTCPHPPLVLAMADEIAGLYSARYPGIDADRVARMLVIFHIAARKVIAAGGTSGDIADAAGHAAVVLARRPDVPHWSMP